MGEYPGKRQLIKDSNAGADGSFAIAKWVPGETNPRLEVAKRLVLAPEGLNRHLGGGGETGQDSERVMGLSRHRRRLIAQAKIQCEVRAQTPIILNVDSKQRLSHINWSSGRLIVQVNAAGLVDQKARERWEIKLSIWRNPARELIVLHMLEGKPEFQRVVAASKEGIVIEL